MYLIEILHQTTTAGIAIFNALTLYLIEILHQTTTPWRIELKTPELYLIEILHQTTTPSQSPGLQLCCILSKFYIKPQHYDFEKRINYSCILSKFYIKPQHYDFEKRINYVVSYRNSTSNHNFDPLPLGAIALYLIEILHQTTTKSPLSLHNLPLYLIEILHQTTTPLFATTLRLRCILSKFYIKPQRITPDYLSYRVVSYRNSTSNHNLLEEFVNS